MKPKTLLDTVYIVRLYGSGLFSKAMEKIKVHLVPAVFSEIKSSRVFELEKLIKEGTVILEEITENCHKQIIHLIKSHKGKEHSTNYQKGRLNLVHDLGEFQIMAIVQKNPDKNYKILTFDKKAKKVMKRELRIKQSLVTENEEQELLGFSDIEMKRLRRGFM